VARKKNSDQRSFVAHQKIRVQNQRSGSQSDLELWGVPTNKPGTLSLRRISMATKKKAAKKKTAKKKTAKKKTAKKK